MRKREGGSERSGFLDVTPVTGVSMIEMRRPERLEGASGRSGQKGVADMTLSKIIVTPRGGGMSAPAIYIRLPLEGVPRVYSDAVKEGESDRLLAWIASHPRLVELLELALDLEQEEAKAA